MAALADDNLEELPGVSSNKGEFATKCAGASYCRELLQDSGFKLVEPIKFLEVDNDLVSGILLLREKLTAGGPLVVVHC